MVKPAISKTLVKDNIKKALERNADIEVEKVEVIISGHQVTLKGKPVHGMKETSLKGAAWSSPA